MSIHYYLLLKNDEHFSMVDLVLAKLKYNDFESILSVWLGNVSLGLGSSYILYGFF